MKKLLYLNSGLVIIAITIGIFNFIQLKSGKIAFIDTVKILGSSHELNEIRKDAEVKRRQLQAQTDTLFAELQAGMKELEERSLSANEIQLAKKNMNFKEMQFRKYIQTNKKKIEGREIEQTKNILARVTNIVSIIASKEGYDIVFGANGSGSLVYGNNAIDISSTVIKILNEE